MIKVPAHLKALGGALQGVVDTVAAASSGVTNGRAVNYEAIEVALADASGQVERAGHGDILRAMAEVGPRIEVRGEVYVQAAQGVGTYYTLAGPIEIERWIYRRAGDRGGSTIDPISVRIGAIGDGRLPQTATAIAKYVQALTSREAVDCVSGTGRLPYSRSSFERVTHEVGSVYRQEAADIEDLLITEYGLPDGASSISVSLDRTSVPMEEPREHPPGRRKKGAPQRPVSRQFRMAWCGTVTLHDAAGAALHTIRYGRMPRGDQVALCEGMCSDVEILLEKNPRLKLATIADGAADVLALLDQHISRKAVGRKVEHLVDFWHVAEYLAATAKAMNGSEAHSTLARWKKTLLDDGDAAAKVLRELRRSRCADVRVADDTPVADAIRYIENHRHLMNYAATRRAHLPIGSGNVEATCKTLVGVRMKRCGSRWMETTGDDILRLRALALSDRWESAMSLTLATLRSAVRRVA